MINILPPEAKKQINYAKSNSRLLRYLLIALIIFSTLGALLTFSLWLAQTQANDLKARLDELDTKTASYSQTEKNVERLNSNLETIEKLLNQKTTFSILLADLASVLPANSYITKMSLTGEDEKPMEMLISTDSFNRAAEVRNGLITSPRIKSADIQSVSRNEQENNFTVVMIVGFEKGQAR